ncbi:hypothetical protein GCM10010377_68280 [Streptomyces viridiviolaceus]|uniref:Uncharacterized protein n=1 Tax=Streptomyces viridiviolaceus TaxID=68282 RepID=A0ABW2ECF8_9ACTN|nr:hypothetical protein [Streptomyces viridiviolaceus]GHB67726.1 hypothetical protein GCM10010377_68280 [Streptomyces viridiviolaceus]
MAPDCPHQRLAEKRLWQALDDTGLNATGFTKPDCSALPGR